MANKLKIAFGILIYIFALNGCGIYNFSGTNIDYDKVKYILIHPVENQALKVNPALSNTLTDALNDQYRRLTKLQLVTDDSLKELLELSCVVTSYDIKPIAVTADEYASKNRLTITVKIQFTNHTAPDENIEQSFSSYDDYDAMTALESVEAGLVENIIKTLVGDIFNATVAQW